MARSGLRSHLSGSLPISIAIHLVVLLAIFVIPLVANVVVPAVIVTLPDYVRVAPMPPPPVVTARQEPRSPNITASDSSAAPTHAPDTLHAETAQPSFVPGPVLDATAGLPTTPGALPTGPVISAPPPPDPPKPAGPVRVADLPVAPRKTVDVRPIYPDIARLARVEGTVIMEAMLDPSGHVTQLRVIKSVPMLDQAALDAVRQWRYTPSLYYGRPVSVLMTVTVRFTLQ
jgi:protein TonB